MSKQEEKRNEMEIGRGAVAVKAFFIILVFVVTLLLMLGDKLLYSNL